MKANPSAFDVVIFLFCLPGIALLLWWNLDGADDDPHAGDDYWYDMMRALVLPSCAVWGLLYVVPCFLVQVLVWVVL